MKFAVIANGKNWRRGLLRVNNFDISIRMQRCGEEKKARIIQGKNTLCCDRVCYSHACGTTAHVKKIQDAIIHNSHLVFESCAMALLYKRFDDTAQFFNGDRKEFAFLANVRANEVENLHLTLRLY